MDTVRQLEYVAVSRATDTATVITDMAKVEDSPLNHEANQFSKTDEHLYAAKTERTFITKLNTLRCLECTSCATFLSSSLMVSMTDLLRNRILSYNGHELVFHIALLHIRCNLKPKYHPMVLLPLSA